MDTCRRCRWKAQWPHAASGNWSIASGSERPPLNYSASLPSVHRAVTAAGRVAAQCHGGLEAAGFNAKGEKRGTRGHPWEEAKAGTECREARPLTSLPGGNAGSEKGPVVPALGASVRGCASVCIVCRTCFLLEYLHLEGRGPLYFVSR